MTTSSLQMHCLNVVIGGAAAVTAAAVADNECPFSSAPRTTLAVLPHLGSKGGKRKDKGHTLHPIGTALAIVK